MNCRKILVLFLFFFFGLFIQTQAQIAKSVDEMEAAYKECIHIKSDSVACYRKFHQQMDSMIGIVFEKVRAQTPAAERADFIQSQLSWSKKKADLYKKLDETFVYNLQDGIWKKDMIRISYQQKAEFVLKRIKVLLKKLTE